MQLNDTVSLQRTIDFLRRRQINSSSNHHYSNGSGANSIYDRRKMTQIDSSVFHDIQELELDVLYMSPPSNYGDSDFDDDHLGYLEDEELFTGRTGRKKIPLDENKDDHKNRKNIPALNAKSEPLEFVKKPVVKNEKNSQNSGPSMLRKMLSSLKDDNNNDNNNNNNSNNNNNNSNNNNNNKKNNCLTRVMSASKLGSLGTINLTIYLPNRNRMDMQVYESATVDEVIRAILNEAGRNDNGSPDIIYYNEPQIYELRLYEDGEPSEDFPALDRARKLKHFSDGDNHEYCLRRIPGARPPLGRNQIPAAPFGNFANEINGYDQFSDMVMPKGIQMRSLSIILPNLTQLEYAICDETNFEEHLISEKTKGKDLLRVILQENYRLLFSADRYIFKMTEMDKERRKLLSAVINLEIPIIDNGVEEILLTKKNYMDAPQIKEKDSDRQQTHTRWEQNLDKDDDRSNVASGEDNRPDADTFMYTDVSASKYEEWNVVKKNKFGRRQSRVMGIDDTKIYNYKKDSLGGRKYAGVYRAYRNISTVKLVEFMDKDNTSFRVTFEEDGSLTTVEYTADSPTKCAEIVYKLQYIIKAPRSKKSYVV